MNIPELIKEAHDNAIERGFYDCPECGGKGYIEVDRGYKYPDRDDCELCENTGINPNKNIGELLMLIVSELGEALEAHRNNRFSERIKECPGYIPLLDEWSTPNFKMLPATSRYFEQTIKNTFEDELADVFIRLFDLCGYLGIELKTYDNLEMQCFENIGQELLWWTATLSNLPGFIEYYKEIDDIEKEIQEISLTVKRIETFCQKHNIPIEKHIQAKMAYNRTRPRKHGKEY